MNPKRKSKSKRVTNPEFWDTNAHSILILQSLLRDAKMPGDERWLT